MPSADELRAALAVAELEEKLVAAKAAGGASTELKLELREARQAYREMVQGRPVEPGDATVTPATVKASATVASPGGN